MLYTVKQLSHLAGVSIRTLHYYDEIGLLEPEKVGDNSYRYYGEESVLRLQQILFYRELEIPLGKIKSILDHPSFDQVVALEGHRKELEKRSAKISNLIRTVDDTIQFLKGEKSMSEKQLFQAFSDEEQEKLAREAENLYDPETVRESNRKWKTYSSEQKKKIFDEGNRVYTDLIASIPEGPTSQTAQAGVERWRTHMNYFWTPSLDQLVGLAEMYNTDPRFKANFDQMDPRLANFMRDAVKFYVQSRK